MSFDGISYSLSFSLISTKLWPHYLLAWSQQWWSFFNVAYTQLYTLNSSLEPTQQLVAIVSRNSSKEINGGYINRLVYSLLYIIISLHEDNRYARIYTTHKFSTSMHENLSHKTAARTYIKVVGLYSHRCGKNMVYSSSRSKMLNYYLSSNNRVWLRTHITLGVR